MGLLEQACNKREQPNNNFTTTNKIAPGFWSSQLYV
jgi:hypothetical protein